MTEKYSKKLEIGNFHVKDIVFGDKTSYKDGVLTVNKEEAIAALKTKNEKWLQAYLSIHAMGFEVEPRVLISKTIGKDITHMAHEEGVDLIIKAHEVHGMFDSVLFTPLDWQLLRHAPVPVLIAKDHIWVIPIAATASAP